MDIKLIAAAKTKVRLNAQQVKYSGSLSAHHKVAAIGCSYASKARFKEGRYWDGVLFAVGAMVFDCCGKIDEIAMKLSIINYRHSIDALEAVERLNKQANARLKDGDAALLKWRGIAHSPIRVTIIDGRVLKHIVNRDTGELLNPKTGAVEGWLQTKSLGE